MSWEITYVGGDMVRGGEGRGGGGRTGLLIGQRY